MKCLGQILTPLLENVRHVLYLEPHSEAHKRLKPITERHGQNQTSPVLEL
jgi:hypothetical protein